MDIAEQIRTDPDAGARSLMADFGPGLHAFALQLCGNRADADDLYMRTMETALARIGEQRGPSFAAWLRSICANLRRMDLRRGGVPVVEAEVLERIPEITIVPGRNYEKFTFQMTAGELEEIVRTDSKQRYSFNEDHTLIRANQGHSISVDVELEEKVPPEILWHGTGEKYVSSIDAQGLIPKSRLYVHLSSDPETARKVGSRHGKPVIYMVDCAAMSADGYPFFLSANQVWLTKTVPAKYLRKV